MNRRALLKAGGGLVLGGACAHRGPAHPPTPIDLSDLEARAQGRIGVAALDTATGRWFAYRAAERHAMCSTFKSLLAALVLARADEDKVSLSASLTYSKDDLIFWSPVTEKNVTAGAMTIEALCKATVTTSDNTAANLLLRHIGGPAAFTADLRRFGDTTTRLDRYELELNENAPGDPRDTTTPRAMTNSMAAFAFGRLLIPKSQATLRSWLQASVTGRQRLRAGLPSGWQVGDKTGSSANNQSNDVAIAMPQPDVTRHGVVITSFLNVPNAMSKTTNAIHAEIARRLARRLSA